MKLLRQVAVWLLSQVAAPLLVEEAASRAGGSPVVVEGAEAVGIQVMEAAEAITGGLSEVSCGFTVKDRGIREWVPGFCTSGKMQVEE